MPGSELAMWVVDAAATLLGFGANADSGVQVNGARENPPIQRTEVADVSMSEGHLLVCCETG